MGDTEPATQPPTAACLRAVGISFAHEPHHPILHDCSLAVYPGEIIALLGANGSGKSTLLKLLAGAWRPATGHVERHGTPLDYSRKGRDQHRQAVQLVLQEPDDQIFAVSVAADVAFGPTNLELDPDTIAQRVAWAMEACEITDLARRVPHQLSYGQRKRVALAGALAMQPSVLLLDEPTAGLDPAGARQLLATISLQRAAGRAILLATHEVDTAWEIADRVAIMHEGTVRIGPARTMLRDQQLLAAARLGQPWAPMVEQLTGTTITKPADLAAWLAANQPPLG
ncbi:energy-coupling factor ABC transporter ATP-binding protein [Corynebacterium choanae]|uniref:ABC transporter ATP-binding protein n=1 Tax=Corynebacterium choanae TaxID=1862358 RepID=A0A3G6J7F9_9CORY|nr:ABC transporter ATP-binding protein [Corynebacterium choanae]AZA12848.1 Cobalt import ATP-binding protein CbiO [Corynebacterium choanae]